MNAAPAAVLLLEDDADLAATLALLLEERGFMVWAATDFDQALELAEQAGSCTVLLDLSLPGDAAAFVRALRESPGFRGRVLLFSASSRLEERALELGADGALAKPCELDALIAALHPAAADDAAAPAG